MANFLMDLYAQEKEMEQNEEALLGENQYHFSERTTLQREKALTIKQLRGNFERQVENDGTEESGSGEESKSDDQSLRISSFNDDFQESKEADEKQENKFLVCVDPDSLITYLLNIKSDNKVNNQIIIESETIDEGGERTHKDDDLLLYRERIKAEKNTINELLDIPHFKWEYGHGSEADKYRRRKFQKYLLSKEASEYPSYAYQSQLSKAFDKNPSIEVEVHLNEYSDKLIDSSPISNKQSLVTSAQEVLKYTKRKIESRESPLKAELFKFKPRSDRNEFVLKAFGYREYLIGGYPLLAYDRVRKALRRKDILKLTLTEKPNNESKDAFPIIVKTHPKIKMLKRVSPFYWYPPETSLDVQLNKIKRQQFNPNLTPDERYKIGSEQEKPTMILHKYQQHLNKMPYDNFLDDVDVVMYSAEINWKFRIKLCGLQHLNLVFRELESYNKPGAYRVATNNGEGLPRNLTNMFDHKDHKQQVKESKKVIKEKKKEESKHKQRDQGNEISWLIHRTIRLADPEHANKYMQHLQFPYDFPFINYSNNFQYLRHLEKFKMVLKGHKKDSTFKFFTPYTIQVEAQLIHGCQVLAESSTKAIPFSYSPRFNQWLSFKLDQIIPEELFQQHMAERKKNKIFEYKDQNEEGEEEEREERKSGEKNQKTMGGKRKIDWYIRYCQLPKKTRLGFNIKAISSRGEERIIASCSFLIFDSEGTFQEGKHAIKVWPFYKVDERLGCMKQYSGYEDFGVTDDLKKPRIFPELVIQCERFGHKMMWFPRDESLIEKSNISSNLIDDADKKLISTATKNQTIADMKKLLDTDPISSLMPIDKTKIFECREHYMKISTALPIFLRSVDWLHPLQVNEVLKLLKGWEKMSDEEAISLLDAKFADQYVRLYALERISKMSDDNMALYMLQFSQSLLYEDYHYNALGEMLLERSLNNPYVVGHAFFWSLRANLHLRTSYERFSLLLQQFLMLCGKFKKELQIQSLVNDQLSMVSQQVQNYGEEVKKLKKLAKKNKEPPPLKVSLMAKYQLLKKREKLPAIFTLAIEPKVIVRDFSYPKLLVFDSKKKPLRIVGINQQIGGQDINVMFKFGDDLRQDILTLQFIYLMDKIWLQEGLDLNMTPYRVLGTGDQRGYLEFVTNSKTIAAMQKGSKMAAFNDASISKFIEARVRKKYEHEDEKVREEKIRNHIELMRDNFLRSTAGYCVATYILGIGDRHPDNIMVNVDNGTLLHIDFGHILGDKKKKFGIERERDPFVLTRQMGYFINQNKKCFVKTKKTKSSSSDLKEEADLDSQPSWKTDSFKRFEDECVKAYNHLRKNGVRFINLLLIMLSAGIPQLKHEKNIEYVKQALKMNMTNYQAKVDFKKQIIRALKTWSRRFDNFIHNWKHA